MSVGNDNRDSRNIGQQQARHLHEERCLALRALLMTPLMTPAHAEFAAVRRHTDELRIWFARETGWTLHVERDCARLYKRPADLRDASRGIPDYDRRRYALLCLACAVLERADQQITLRVLGERLLLLAAEPSLASRGFSFTLQAQHERRELVAVCRSLLELGVLTRVAGDEESFVRSIDGNSTADALYDVQRRVLAGMLAAVRGPSTWSVEEMPISLEERLSALVTEHVHDSDEGRRTALRHQLSRRLLDDPVIYFDALETHERAYLLNQRGAMAARLCDATDLVAEQRAEGLALIDEIGALTDVAMPAEGTEAHVTLLVAEFLASHSREPDEQSVRHTWVSDVSAFVARAKNRFSTYWRKSAREPGAEVELARTALGRLQQLQLVSWQGESVRPLPALARFAVGETQFKSAKRTMQTSLFDTP